MSSPAMDSMVAAPAPFAAEELDPGRLAGSHFADIAYMAGTDIFASPAPIRFQICSDGSVTEGRIAFPDFEFEVLAKLVGRTFEHLKEAAPVRFLLFSPAIGRMKGRVARCPDADCILVHPSCCRRLEGGHSTTPAEALWGEQLRERWLSEEPLPLRHLATMELDLARAALLRGRGLDTEPLALARRLQRAGRAPHGSAAHLVCLLGEHWEPTAHRDWPEEVRRLASDLVGIGWKLSTSALGGGAAQPLMDVWLGHVMPYVIQSFAWDEFVVRGREC